MEEQRQRGEEERASEREREREIEKAPKLNFFLPVVQVRSLPSPKNCTKIDQMIVVSLSRSLAMSIYLLISRTVVGSSRNRSYSL